MRRLTAVSALVLCFGLMSPAAFAQGTAQDTDHERGSFGAYFDWTRLQFAKLNMHGVGGRAGINIRPAIVLEGEMAYDFQASVSQSITSGGITNTFSSNVRLIHGLFGPKFQTTTGRVRVFGVAKGGVLNFGITSPIVAGSAGNQVSTIRDGETDGVFYAGGGIEFPIKIVWIRVEAGDEIFFDHGANHNFKLMAGPQFRF